MLSLLSYLYLALPLGIFFLAWLRAPYATAFSGALIMSGILMYKNISPSKNALPIITLRNVFLVLVVIAWVFFSGAGGLSFQNGDWIKHNAILSDLIIHDWPVRYSVDGVGFAFLDYYLGWYMVPAFVGKIYNTIQAAFIAQYVWTTIGVLLSFAWLSRIIKKPHWTLYVFFILFATADSLGILLLRNTNLLNFMTPLEHWSTHEYSSFTTLLYWVPGQAIGIWIVMGVLIDAWKRDRSQSLPIWIALLAFWSPFGVIGMVPFIPFMMYRLYKKGSLMNRTLYIHSISACLILIFFYLFFHANIFTSTYGKDFSGLWKGDSLIGWARFGVFLVSEVLLPLALIFSLRSHLDKHLKTLFYICVPILILLPFYRYGLLNDLVMRASIPALYVVFLCSYTMLVSKKVRVHHKILWLLLAGYFILGAITPLTEINRSLQSQPNVGSSHNLLNIGDELAIKQYVGREDTFIGKYVLR